MNCHKLWQFLFGEGEGLTRCARDPRVGALPKSKVSTASRFLFFYAYTPAWKQAFAGWGGRREMGGRIASIKLAIRRKVALPKSDRQTACAGLAFFILYPFMQASLQQYTIWKKQVAVATCFVFLPSYASLLVNRRTETKAKPAMRSACPILAKPFLNGSRAQRVNPSPAT